MIGIIVVVLYFVVISFYAGILAEYISKYESENMTSGSDGLKGDAGAHGSAGGTGLTGSVGDTGATGATGDTGAQGVVGVNGVDFTQGKITLSNPWVAIGDTMTKGTINGGQSWATFVATDTSKTLQNFSENTYSYEAALNDAVSEDYLFDVSYVNASFITFLGFNDYRLRTGGTLFTTNGWWRNSIASSMFGTSLPQNKIINPRSLAFTSSGMTVVNRDIYTNYGLKISGNSGNSMKFDVNLSARWYIVRFTMTESVAYNYQVTLNGVGQASIRGTTPTVPNGTIFTYTVVIDANTVASREFGIINNSTNTVYLDWIATIDGDETFRNNMFVSIPPCPIEQNPAADPNVRIAMNNSIDNIVSQINFMGGSTVVVDPPYFNGWHIGMNEWELGTHRGLSTVIQSSIQ